jgi:arylsulfatase
MRLGRRALLLLLGLCISAPALAQQKAAPQGKPNILVIFGDDIGMWNVGAYTHGMMGRTPRIDRIAASTYKVHLDGYNNLAHWTGQSEKSARREIFYYDETDLMAVRVDAWKVHLGVKHHGSWFDEKAYPSVPYIINLLMDPMEKMTPDSEEWGYIGRKFVAEKLWAPTAASAVIGVHLKSLADFPPSQGADTLSMRKAVEQAMRKLEAPQGSSN